MAMLWAQCLSFFRLFIGGRLRQQHDQKWGGLLDGPELCKSSSSTNKVPADVVQNRQGYEDMCKALNGRLLRCKAIPRIILLVGRSRYLLRRYFNHHHGHYNR